MSGFGDIEPGDLIDTDPPDPVVMARRFILDEFVFSHDPDRPASFDELHPWEQALLAYTFAELVAWLTREWQKAPL